jgi:N-methylhydantoinase B
MSSMSLTDPQSASFDGVRLAIINKRFESIVRKMANTLLRTGRSGVLNTARDFSCCIVTAEHELLTAAECYPIHVLRGADMMAKAMKHFHPVLRKGDAFLHNSPYHGNSHAADHTILVPVIDDVGEHQFTVLVKAHQADCGNSLPTTYMGAARDVYEEGALIFPAVKVQSNFRDHADIVRMCEMRIRVPTQWRGDYLAMVGAARIGELEIEKLGQEAGWAELTKHTRDWFDYSEGRMIAAIRKLRKGRASARATHDPVPGTPPDGITIQARVAIDPEAAIIEVDLRDNPDAYPCGLNLSEACARSAAMVGIFNCVDHTVPPNGGSYRRVRIHLREGCVVGIPRHPTSCSVATTNLGDRVTCAVQRAMAEIDEHIGMADGGAAIPPAAGVVSGIDPRTDGTPFCNELILGGGGGPGTPTSDGWLTMLTMGNAGMPFIDSIEVDEIHHPILISERRIILDSEGAGKFRGAPGSQISFGPLGCRLDIGYVSDGTINAAKGARGGHPGDPAKQYIVRADGQTERLGVNGLGSPIERDPARVRKDILEGWISERRGAEIYGVMLDSYQRVDEQASKSRRAAMTLGSTSAVASARPF